ncbi:hypothetical protein [Aquabacterium humicola]|uniref:hypothetical protein n=1 Tax=Aquabacterium humicola TaxID=3237377 RepID=UPI00254349C4|nr:hypothetical protein [Rubrivivax pictus]
MRAIYCINDAESEHSRGVDVLATCLWLRKRFHAEHARPSLDRALTSHRHGHRLVFIVTLV